MNRVIKIHPAPLVTNFTDLLFQVGALVAVTKDFDIDIVDWARTKSRTIGVSDALNLKGELNLTFDLMMDFPSKSIKKLINEPRVKTIIINLDCKEDISYLIDLIHHYKKDVGISMNPDNSLEQILPYHKLIDMIQIFTVEPGKQGSPLLVSRLNLLNKLRETGFKGKLGIDGSINLKTIETILKYPVDILSVGSYLCKSTEPHKSFKELESAILKA